MRELSECGHCGGVIAYDHVRSEWYHLQNADARCWTDEGIAAPVGEFR